METPIVDKAQLLPDKQNKRIIDLMPQEKVQLVDDAQSITQNFIDWSTKSPDSIFQKINESPSKKFLLASLSAAGLANLGLTIAGARMGMDPIDIGFLWYASFGGPVLEELIFRSKKIPNLVTGLGNKFGLKLRPDQARLTTNALFTGIHIDQALINPLALPGAFFLGEVMQKMSSEKGLASSLAFHTLWNTYANIANYSLNGPITSFVFRDQSKGLLRNVIKDDKKFETIKKLINIPLQASQIAIGIIGIKELVEDTTTQKLLERLRTVKPGQDSIVDFNKAQQIANKWLAYPSTEGYKFQTGIELAYTTAMLQAPNDKISLLEKENYARTKVVEQITNSWKNQSTLNGRIEKALNYIDQQINKRNQIVK